jgi:hypothetical protein
MCKHTDQFRRTQVDGIYREPILTHQQAKKYQPPQISICKRYAASYYGGFESKGLTVYLKVAASPLSRKLPHPAKNQLRRRDRCTCSAATDCPTAMLASACGEASTGAGTKKPLTSSSYMVFLPSNIRVGRTTRDEHKMAIMFTFTVLTLFPCSINDK